MHTSMWWGFSKSLTFFYPPPFQVFEKVRTLVMFEMQNFGILVQLELLPMYFLAFLHVSLLDIQVTFSERVQRSEFRRRKITQQTLLVTTLCVCVPGTPD